MFFFFFKWASEFHTQPEQNQGYLTFKAGNTVAWL